ncbi:hypothetical protein E3N88_20607 [Mikania micrantha]|uniref:Tf2-1-like SH3-like domain-containing protein n=1 Tax=Mikania micrantha TaxID=192012 RepID=A0A5N6NHW6_9ASTR|nr:hypothetical protein E3N88_20607 [Mikania micrantha]
MEVPVGEHLRLDKYDSTMVDSQRCWQLSRWKYRWVNILDLINMTPQWWIARGAGNCLRWKYRWEELGSWISTAYHSQIDGQEKMSYSCVEEKLGNENWQIKRRIIEFQVGDFVLLKVSPGKCIIYFRKQGKLSPRFIGPFKIIARVGEVACRLELPEELSGIHNTFHMEVPVGEHLRLDKYDSTMVDSQRCWQLSRWKYRWVNILDLINMTPQWWIARGAGNCLRWKYRWVKDRYASGDQIGHDMKQNQTLSRPCKLASAGPKHGSAGPNGDSAGHDDLRTTVQLLARPCLTPRVNFRDLAENGNFDNRPRQKVKYCSTLHDRAPMVHDRAKFQNFYKYSFSPHLKGLDFLEPKYLLFRFLEAV